MREEFGARLSVVSSVGNMGELHGMMHLHSCAGLARFVGLNVRYYNSMRACLSVRSCILMR